MFDELEDAWQLRDDMMYTFQGSNRYFVHFSSKADMVSILKEGSWQFRSNPLVFQGLDLSLEDDSSLSRSGNRRDGGWGNAHQQTKDTQEAHEKGNPAISQYLAEKF